MCRKKEDKGKTTFNSPTLDVFLLARPKKRSGQWESRREANLGTRLEGERALGRKKGLRGRYEVRDRRGCQLWAITRVLLNARTPPFPEKSHHSAGDSTGGRKTFISFRSFPFRPTRRASQIVEPCPSISPFLRPSLLGLSFLIKAGLSSLWKDLDRENG